MRYEEFGILAILVPRTLDTGEVIDWMKNLGFRWDERRRRGGVYWYQIAPEYHPGSVYYATRRLDSGIIIVYAIPL